MAARPINDVLTFETLVLPTHVKVGILTCHKIESTLIMIVMFDSL